MVVNQSFLESLKELNNLGTVNVQDPESDDFESAKISTFEEPSVDSNGGKVFGNLRKSVGENGFMEGKYAGKKGSRKNLNWSDDEEEEEIMDEEEIKKIAPTAKDLGIEDSEDKDDDDEDEEGDEDDIEDEDGDVDMLDEDDDMLDEDDDIDNSDDMDDNDVEEDEEDEDDEIDDDDVDDNTMKIDFSMLPVDLKNGLPKESSQDDDGEGIDTFAASLMDNNLAKGQATKNQLDILDKLLESRIRLQKSLQLCNQLPQHETLHLFKEQSSAQVKESYESAQKLTKDLLGKLLKLQEVLCDSNSETSSMLTTGSVNSVDPGDEEIPSDTEDENEEESKQKPETETCPGLDLPTKRKHTLTVADFGEEIVKRHKAMQPFKDSTIKKWHEKTQLSSNAIKSKNFASFDKSVQQQIRQVLLDKEKLIKRTQLMRNPIKILGKIKIEEKNEDTKNEEAVDLHLTDYDKNIFDDGDFYHEMLKELIERKADIDADDPIAAGRRWLELQKLRSKIKRKVDTRASKGRKVRYDVHSKLVSFMAPQHVGTMSNQAKNNLFASLFGNKPRITTD